MDLFRSSLRIAIGASLILFSAPLMARDKSGDDFPDYNHLEMAKPMPPPDQQVPDKPGGSIDMMVGGDDKAAVTTPDTIPVPILNKPSGPDDSEPPMDGVLDNPPTSVAESSKPVTQP